ncbi:MAG: sigma-70 family RNA polymerase sigma factor [Bacteriovoracaceae bacterium]|nr:sigma-70 family RNA polymerase sigma factor [Bacteroidota bacterium]
MTPNAQILRDTALIERITANDSTALVELYDRHAIMLFSIIMRVLKEKNDSEHVLQSVFVDIWKNEEPYDSRLGNPAAWLSRCARMRAVERLRSKQLQKKSQDTTIDNVHELFTADFTDHPDHRPHLSAQQEEILIALTSLSSEQKVIVEFAFFRGYTYSDLAGHFSIPIETVKIRIRTTVSILRQKLRLHFS